MLLPKGNAVGETLWGDRDGGKAKLTLAFPFSLSLANVFSSTNAVATAIQAISNAVLISITVRYRWYEDAPSTAGAGADLGLYLGLYYSNGVDIEPIYIPAPDTSLLEQSGSFAGIRLDLGDPAVVSLADALTAALANTVGPDDEPWERELLVGGLVR